MNSGSLTFSFDEAKHVITFGRGKCDTIIQGYLYKPTNKLFALKSVSNRHAEYDLLIEKLKKEYDILHIIHRPPTSSRDTITETKEDEQKHDSAATRVSKLYFYHHHIIQAAGLVGDESLSSSHLEVKPVYLVLESVLGGNLFQHLHNSTDREPAFTLTQIRVYMTQLVNILLFLFTKGVIHRDIKLSNLMVNNYGHLKLIDFDSATVLQNRGDRAKTIIGTLHLLAPEMVAYGQCRESLNPQIKDRETKDEQPITGYSYSVDWWNLGHLLYEILTKQFIHFKWFSLGLPVSPQRGAEMKEDKKDLNITDAHRAMAREAIERTSVEHYKRKTSDGFSTPVKQDRGSPLVAWDYNAVSEFTSLFPSEVGNRKDTPPKRNIDYASYIPSPSSSSTVGPSRSNTFSAFEYSEEEFADLMKAANNLIGKLLSVSPEQRFGCSHLIEFEEAPRQKNHFDQFLYSECFQDALQDPFLIKQLLYPQDVSTCDTPEQYHRRLIEVDSKYRFQINEKIGYYEMFPQYKEGPEPKSFSFPRASEAKQAAENEDEETLTEEQQELFKDF